MLTWSSSTTSEHTTTSYGKERLNSLRRLEAWLTNDMTSSSSTSETDWKREFFHQTTTGLKPLLARIQMW
jgi:hypothetical protein